VLKLSSTLFDSVFIQAMKIDFAFPPMQSLINLVNFDPLYGIWKYLLGYSLCSFKVRITLFKANNPLLKVK
jgi:hypothetical protein